jgi:hypothetical protein
LCIEGRVKYTNAPRAFLDRPEDIDKIVVCHRDIEDALFTLANGKG